MADTKFYFGPADHILQLIYCVDNSLNCNFELSSPQVRQRVIWVFDDLSVIELTNNVMPVKYIDQQSVLAHPKVELNRNIKNKITEKKTNGRVLVIHKFNKE